MSFSSLQPSLLVDPSILLSEEGLTWLEEDAQSRTNVVISEVFANTLQEANALDLRALVAPEDAEHLDRRLERLVPLIPSLATYGYRPGEDELSPESRDVAVALYNTLTEGTEWAVYADEWAFLQSYSAMISKTDQPLSAFGRSGAAIVRYGRRFRDRFLAVVGIDEMPSNVTPEFLAKVGGKWLTIGGSAIGGAVVLFPVGAALGPVAIPVVQAFDP